MPIREEDPERQQMQVSDTTDGAPSRPERRANERHRFAGAEVYVFGKYSQIGAAKPKERFLLQLKDMSRGGLSGLIDAPLTIGDIVFVQLEEMVIPAAQVVWFRRAMTGFEFVQPLSRQRLQSLCERHQAGQLWSPAMRARSDLPGWWMDVAEHQRGRRAAYAVEPIAQDR